MPYVPNWLNIDPYSIKARLLPALFVVSPLIFLFEKYAALITSKEVFSYGFATIFVAIIGEIFSSLVRDRGAAKERSLFLKWGGPPTTTLLANPSNIISENDRNRYLAKLAALTKRRDGDLIDSQTENKSFDIEAGISILREFTRGPNFSIIQSENASYGMRRNMFSVKWIGVSITNICLLVCLCFDLLKIGFLNSEFAFGLLTSIEPTRYCIFLSILAIWMFIVQEKWVRQAGDKYAQALIRALDSPSVIKAE